MNSYMALSFIISGPVCKSTCLPEKKKIISTLYANKIGWGLQWGLKGRRKLMTYLWGIKCNNMRINNFSLFPNWLKRIPFFFPESLTHPQWLTVFFQGQISFDFARQYQPGEGERCGLQPGAEEVFFHAAGVGKGSEWEVMKQWMGRI